MRCDHDDPVVRLIPAAALLHPHRRPQQHLRVPPQQLPDALRRVLRQAPRFRRHSDGGLRSNFGSKVSYAVQKWISLIAQNKLHFWSF